MLNRKLIVILAASLMVATVPASAVYNDNITGHVVFVMQTTPGAGYVAETIQFKLDNMPAVTCIAGGFSQFGYSPSSVPDAATRKNFLAMLLTAKATGATVTVAYDHNAGGFCDQGVYGVYYIVLN